MPNMQYPASQSVLSGGMIPGFGRFRVGFAATVLDSADPVVSDIGCVQVRYLKQSRFCHTSSAIPGV